MKGFIALALVLAFCTAQAQITYYKQCDEPWKNVRVGSTRSTICKKGDVLSALAMILSTWKVQCPGMNGVKDDTPCHPGNLNTWLMLNNGYTTGRRVSLSAFLRLGIRGYQTRISSDILAKIQGSAGVVIQIKGFFSDSWVLGLRVTGPLQFAAWDPEAGKEKTYKVSEIKTALIFMRA